jgi:hypothetical protein
VKITDIVVTPDDRTDASGRLTRKGALAAAREKLGQLATISSDDDQPRMVWVVGYPHRSLGQGPDWETAIRRARIVPEALYAK